MLDKYVYSPDSNFQYRLVSSVQGKGFTVYIVDMISQQWRTAADVDRPLWQHWLVIVKPDEVVNTTGMLFISGGSNGRPAPTTADPVFVGLATGSKSVVAELRMIPNQPLTFASDSLPRKEDAIIAYTWDKFMRTGDETWPLRLPMTKAVVRAMDVMTTLCAGLETGKASVEKYVLIGGSKRGWAAWTTAAVDDRVIAVAPASIDVLNVEASFEHHFRCYGFWAPALKDYTDMGIMDWSGTPEFRALMKIEDPYSYRERLTIPKFVVNSTGDQYFVPDSSQFYFPGLKGEKYLRYVPNTRHDLENSDAYLSMIAFYESIIMGRPRPEFQWESAANGSIVVESADRPAAVRLWQATNPVARDFRLDTLGPAWTSTPVEPASEGRYVARVQEPAKGWTAYFVELTYPSQGKFPFKFTTDVRVVPDVLPFPSPEKR
jgi:PhoPQ-activated pathogenicity-related protein